MTEDYVLVATDKLREHADYVRAARERVWFVARKLDAGELPVTAWGVPNATSDYDPSKPGDWDYAGHPGEALQRAKSAYEKAHKEAVDRVYELTTLYGDTARGLDTVASNYDLSDMREPRSRYRQEPR